MCGLTMSDSELAEVTNGCVGIRLPVWLSRSLPWMKSATEGHQQIPGLLIRPIQGFIKGIKGQKCEIFTEGLVRPI